MSSTPHFTCFPKVFVVFFLLCPTQITIFSKAWVYYWKFTIKQMEKPLSKLKGLITGHFCCRHNHDLSERSAIGFLRILSVVDWHITFTMMESTHLCNRDAYLLSDVWHQAGWDKENYFSYQSALFILIFYAFNTWIDDVFLALVRVYCEFIHLLSVIQIRFRNALSQW